jgi:hypothetical protein
VVRVLLGKYGYGIVSIQTKERVMSTTAILLIVLVVLLVGGLPAWPYSRGWGYYPSGILGTILVIVLIMMLLGAL